MISLLVNTKETRRITKKMRNKRYLFLLIRHGYKNKDALDKSRSVIDDFFPLLRINC